MSDPIKDGGPACKGMTASPSILFGLDLDAYKAAPALNASLAKWLLVSPAHYKAALTAEREETLAMRIGSAVHSQILEGKPASYVVKPEGMSLSTKEGRAWKALQTLPIMSRDEAETVARMVDSIQRNQDAQRYLGACPEREISVFATYRGVPIKARLDGALIAGTTRHAILDLKTATDASPREFGKAVANYEYLLSACWYRNALSLATGNDQPAAWAWVVVENSNAAATQIYRPAPEQLDIGQRKMDKCIEVFLECSASGKWPAYFEGEGTFVLPKYYEMEAAALT